MIKLFEQYNDYNIVKSWLDEMEIKNYTINDDLTVYVDGNVELSLQNLTEIPVQFSVVSGHFFCDKNRLTTLKGCPTEVGIGFYCYDNKLTSLEYGPVKVDNDYFCYNNNITTLKYFPKEIGGFLNISRNPLPDEVRAIMISDEQKYKLVKHQEEYGIWNNDGSLNKPRLDMFFKDLTTGILK